MIADTSALVAVILGEEDAELYLDAMSSASRLGISAASLLEASMVVEARQGTEASHDLQALLADLEAEVVPCDEEQAQWALEAWRRFGKGRHPAALNFGDCLAYACAAATGEPLLFKGRDFTQTDVPSALPLSRQ